MTSRKGRAEYSGKVRPDSGKSHSLDSVCSALSLKATAAEGLSAPMEVMTVRSSAFAGGEHRVHHDRGRLAVLRDEYRLVRERRTLDDARCVMAQI